MEDEDIKGTNEILFTVNVYLLKFSESSKIQVPLPEQTKHQSLFPFPLTSRNPYLDHS